MMRESLHQSVQDKSNNIAFGPNTHAAPTVVFFLLTYPFDVGLTKKQTLYGNANALLHVTPHTITPLCEIAFIRGG